MEEKEKKNQGWNFAFGIGIGILLYKVIFDVIIPMIFTN